MRTSCLGQGRTARTAALGSVGLIALVFLFGCSNLGIPTGDNATPDNGDTTPLPGSITVTLTGASEAEGNYFYVLAYEAGEWRINMASYVVGAGKSGIASGSASCTLKNSIDVDWNPTGETLISSGGAVLDIYVYLLSGATGEMLSVHSLWPTTLEAIDGDKTVSVDFAQFVDYVPTDGTLTWSLSGGAQYIGKTLYIGVVEKGVDPTTPLADGGAIISADGTAVVLAQIVPDGGTWTGTGDQEYDVYAFIDMDGTGNESGLTSGDLLYSPAPITYWQYGDAEMPTIGADYEPYTAE